MSILDETDRGLLALLQKNDRLSLAEIGQELKLAPSTVNDRIKRLVRNEIISGFHAKVNPEKVGLDLLAFVFVGWNEPQVETAFLRKVAESDAVLECHHVTGAWNYLIKVRLANTRDLEKFLAQELKSIDGLMRTETLIVLSSAKEVSSLGV
ncbi:Lrp/AsnC family transcriptional regulator [Rhizobium alvei]|uniref:Lrp/AsnC family transcriptional regulator n=1 Tax=Rhizobium alvei TaxID=1132659 RepID=A0ABT8YM04_9HYPH|nr:Lrp/AsnC family transcriptional regulator [Rhizobium alvei]MDO6964771.1 Lrp/AsnC family transcriptional regulator [Rhizobium alvei]